MSSVTSMKPVSTTKRNRTSSQSSGSSANSRQHVAHKSTRISASPPAEHLEASAAAHPLLCTLPPTCSHKPTPLANTKELESHYATYHAHVCEQPECGCVFPDARLLELHQSENHDPIAAMRKDKGEKTFACHLASCPRLFANPKGRRLHLISAHGYPKEYFFAVTNKGVGGLLKKWGEGASMVRGKWSPRDPDISAKGNEGSHMEVDKGPVREKIVIDEDDSDESDEDDQDSYSEEEERPNKPRIYTSEITSSRSDNRMPMDQDPEATPRPPVSSSLPPAATPPPAASKPLQSDILSAGFSALSLVPSSVRFGRGGKVGFAHRPRQPSQPEADAKPVTTIPPTSTDGGESLRGREKPARGRGGNPHRGRGDGTGRGVPARGRGRGRGGAGRGT